ncbi:uncharacterized protein LOC110098647 [Dendrobium catenatum]|uniref:uncharacterized protein LOC110098647 n=1 Tax=Dendrobium catenatum TaxID=906689 RepID=UPI0009F2A817|nr:uncharacterized protein LOC110098647 [Dendrobium catenatum]
MDLPDPDMTDGQSASQATLVNSTTPVVGSDTVSQFATLVAQMMIETQNRASTVRSADIDRHLQMFLRLKPPRFEGTLSPEQLRIDGEAERWWMGRQEEKFQVCTSFCKTANTGDFSAIGSREQDSDAVRGRVYYFSPICSTVVERARLIENDLMATQQRWTTSRKRFSGDAYGSGFFGKKRFVSGDPKKSGQSMSTTVSGSGSTTSFGSVSGAPAGSDRRSESRSDSFARSAGRLRTVPPCTIFKGSSGIVGGSGSMAKRPPSGDQRESGSSVAPAPVQPCVYSLNHHSVIFERYFDALHLDSVTLLVSLSVLLPAVNNLIARKFSFCEIDIFGMKWKSCLILLPISSYDVILGMDWLSLYESEIDCLKKQGYTVFLTSARDMNIDVGFISDIPIVREFSDVFPEELVGFPPDRDVEFCIDIFSGMAPISKAPYRMAPKKLSKLKAQL